jgi:hypothetical protein
LNQAEARIHFMRRLVDVAQRLPNGLLQRLVEDAEFFAEWQKDKRRARGKSRAAQFSRWKEQAEDVYWKGINR